MLPRLPNELPPPRRASASPGVNATSNANTVASRKEERRIAVRFSVNMSRIWCCARSGASHRHPLHPDRRRIGASAELEIIGGREVGEHVEQIACDGNLGGRFGNGTIPDHETR